MSDNSSESEGVRSTEKVEDELLENVDEKKKARLRTRGPYRKASTKNLPDTS